MAATSRRLLEVAIALAGFALGGMGAVGKTAPAQPLTKTVPAHPRGKTASPPPFNKTATITVDAASVQLDYGTHHLIFHEPVISQSDLRITAERADATGLDFQNSRWIFTGDVHLSSEYRGKLDSDEAVVEFRDNQMQTAVATGNPAQFEQTDSTTGVLARGHADNIQYAVTAGTIRLTKDAWLKYGDNNEVTAPELTYDIKGQRFLGASRPGQRVHLTIVPKKIAPAVPKAGARPPSSPAPKARSESSESQGGSGAPAKPSSGQGPAP
jgi:lipopolysaccharide transport protein LptA